VQNALDKMGIKNKVSQTLFIPLYMKAQQTNASDPFFHDSTAVKLISEANYDLSIFNKSVRSSLGCALRARYFDQKVANFIHRHSNPIIINLGCGLDARYQRVRELTSKKAQFYNLDLPDVIKLRNDLLPESDENKNMAASIFETDWMNNLLEKHPNGDFLLTVEGVLMYFEKEKVKSVLKNISNHFLGSEIVFDATNSWMVKHSSQHDTIKHTNAEFHLSLDEPKEIEKWSNNLHLLTTTYYSSFKEFKRVGLLSYFIMRWIPKIHKASYIVTCSVGCE